MVGYNGREGKAFVDYTERIKNNKARITTIDDNGIASYRFAVDGAASIISGIWSIGKENLKPGETILVGHKSQGDGKDFAEVTLDKTSAAIIVKPIEGKKGSLKAALTINGKKYSLSIKVINK